MEPSNLPVFADMRLSSGTNMIHNMDSISSDTNVIHIKLSSKALSNDSINAILPGWTYPSTKIENLY